MAKFNQVVSYLRHWLNEVDDHSVHSPYFFDFYNKVVRGGTPHPDFVQIEKTRAQLESNSTVIEIQDFGSGSKHFGNTRKLSEVATTSLAPPFLAQFFFRIVRHSKAKRILELGTSLGVTSLYLGLLPETQVFTFEGSKSLAQVALTNFEFFDKKNIHLREGNIQSTLPDFLQDPAKLDFVLMDANHRYDPTIQYFEWMMRRFTEKTILVIDDIHQSDEMEKAWNELKRHDLVYASIDLYRCGILVFDPDLKGQHYVWSF